MEVKRLRVNGQHFYGDYGYKFRDDVVPVSYSSSSSSVAGMSHIEHRVSKMDTLAGVAIKYGVEVADIRRLNGLVNDLQMFAHKTLQIPLPGRHPPSPCISNGATNYGEYTPTKQQCSDVFDLLETFNLKNASQKVSPTMVTLQEVDRLRTKKNESGSNGTELTVFKTSSCHVDDRLLSNKGLLTSDTTLNHHCRSRTLCGCSVENGNATTEKAVSEAIDSSGNEGSIRRRQKVDAYQPFCTSEMLKEDNIYSFSTRATKGLALRTKFGSRTDIEMLAHNIESNVDSLLNNGPLSVRKSISSPSFQEAEKSSSMWPTSKWPLKQDVLSRPLIDGLPKPITLRRVKTALD